MAIFNIIFLENISFLKEVFQFLIGDGLLSLLIIVAFIIEEIKNWNGSPELRTIDKQFSKMNENLSELIDKL